MGMPLKGWKTYIVATAIVVLGVMSAVGVDIQGVTLPEDWFVTVLEGLGIAALRKGIAG